MLLSNWRAIALAKFLAFGLVISPLFATNTYASYANKQDVINHSCLDNNSLLLVNTGGYKSHTKDLNMIERAQLKSMQKEFDKGIVAIENEYARKQALYKALLRSSSATASEVGKLSLELQELEKEITIKNNAFMAEIDRKFK